MSVDNVIAIGRFPKKENSDGFEYRVIHAQAIDNCDYDFGSDYVLDCQRALYYAKAPSFDEKSLAIEYSLDLHKEVIGDGTCEYGISIFTYDRELLNVTKEEAERVMDSWYKSIAIK